MGRGNICIHGNYEGLYYIDKDYIDVYFVDVYFDSKDNNYKCEADIEDFNSDISYDEILSEDNYNEFIETFKMDFKEKYKSFYESKDSSILLENELFTIEIKDNEWSYAILLLQKEQDYYKDGNIENLQKRHFQTYLNGMKDCLFNQFNKIGIYGGPWTHGTLYKEEKKVS